MQRAIIVTALAVSSVFSGAVIGQGVEPAVYHPSDNKHSVQFTRAATSRYRTRHYQTGRRVVVRRRSKKKSLAIVGGSAAGGAAIGALAGGGKGAAIGALVGGGSGLIYDRATHKKTVVVR